MALRRRISTFVVSLTLAAAALFDLEGCSGSARPSPPLSPPPARTGLHWTGCSDQPRKATAFPLPQRFHGQLFTAAHRGRTDLFPGNSLKAIASAVEAGVGFIEIDVRATTDGKLFLFHDRRLERENVEAPEAWYGRPADSLSAAELAQLRLRTRSPEVPPQPIALFAEALDTVQSAGASTLLLDLKGDAAAHEQLLRRVIAAARKAGALSRVVVQCQGRTELDLARTVAPEIAVLARLQSPEEANDALHKLPLVVQGDAEWMSAELIASIHRAGSLVLLKRLGSGLDNDRGWAEAIQQGADILLSDEAGPLQRWGCTHYPASTPGAGA